MTSRTVRFDPHVHTNASFDASGSVEAVLQRASEVGLDAVAITDHDTTVAAREALELAPVSGLAVVPGVEVSTRDGHVLALGVVDRPPVGDPLGATVSWIREAGGLAVVPHPFQRSRHGVRKRDLGDCDGIEVFNAWAMTGIQNRRARRFATRNDEATLGGSDAHDPRMVGRGHTAVTVRAADGGPPTPEAILAGIAAGRTRAVGRTASTRRVLGKYSRSVGRRVLGHVPLARGTK